MALTRKVWFAVIALIIGGGAVAYWMLGGETAAATQLIKGKVERGSIRISVTATGTLEAVKTVQVGSQISGQISALHADFNSKVRKGQLLAEIDPRTLKSQLLSEQASAASVDARMQSSQADLINQQANLVQVKANLRVAQVTDENNQLLYDRAKQLREKGLIAQNDLDVARANAESSAAKVEQAQAAVTQAEAQIRSRQASIEEVKAQIAGAQAQLDRAQINLDLTKIYSPVDGVVISRSVDLGQTVAASLSAPTLFLIAEDLTRMQVKANIDEADIGKITPDVRASFTVDAYPNDLFFGEISEVRLEPTTVQNVVTYGVIIGVDNAQLKLKPGMTANLTIIVDEHDDVLTAPNAALRFNPPDLTPEQIAKMIDELPPLPPPARAGALAEGARDGQPGARTSVSGDEDGAPEARGRIGQDAAAQRGGGARGGARGGGRGGRGGGGRNQRSVLWTQDAVTRQFKPIRVRLGISDGTRTEVSGPDVVEGQEILVGNLTQSAAPAQQAPARNPLVPNIGGGRGRGGF
jgi:HlyD family secretion protein